MTLIKYVSIALIAWLPLSATAAQLLVEMYGTMYEQVDENFDPVDPPDFFDVYIQMHMDTSTAETSIGNYTGAILDLFAVFDFATTALDTNAFGPGAAYDVFVGAAGFGNNGANIYVQDFFVGNINLELASTGADFNNDIDIFNQAAGDPGAVFDLSGDGSFGSASYGSLQNNDGEYYFDIYDMDITTVSSVPVPAAVWLFGSALLGLGAIKRKKA